MICVSISNKNPQTCLELLDKAEMAEIRLDLTGFEEEAIRQIFSHSTPCIATCRPDELGFEKQEALLKLAMDTGAKYVDVETEAPADLQARLVSYAKERNCRVIISYHDYDITPPLGALQTIAETCYLQGGDVAKIAVTAKSMQDAARVLALHDTSKPIVALAMGSYGKITRLLAPALGSEFTFAAADEQSATAPGQISFGQMMEAQAALAKYV